MQNKRQYKVHNEHIKQERGKSIDCFCPIIKAESNLATLLGKRKEIPRKGVCFDSTLISISINEAFHYRKLAIFDVMTMLFIK